MATKAFAVFLQDLRDGRAHAELSAQLAELLAKVKETGKGGTITFKLKVKPAGRGADFDKVMTSDSISLDLPKVEHGEDVFWLTEDNDLSRNHPRQGTLELREAPTTTPTQYKDASK